VEDCILTELTGVTFDDIAALEDAKQLIREAVVLPLLLPEFFSPKLRRPWKGVLLHGPPGTGKTMLAKAAAESTGSTFFNVTASVLVSKWHGESEKIVHALFKVARDRAPSIIFLDEVDAVASERKSDDSEHEGSRRLKSELLAQLDGIVGDDYEVGKEVLVLATTNRPWDLDEAFRRRLEKRIYVPLPDAKGRHRLLELCVRGLQLAADVRLEDMAERLEGYSGADMHTLCRGWAMLPMRRLLAEGQLAALQQQSQAVLVLNLVDFEEALQTTKPSVSPGAERQFQEWQREFGSS
jgi:katanin p60 ATPase-containing subunit A1